MAGCCGAYGGLSRLWERLAGKLPPFEGCCIDHDREYVEQNIGRADADLIFRECVAATAGVGWAWLLYLPVRAFGWFWWRSHK